MEDYQERVRALKAEIAGLDVPCYLLRILRINEIRSEQLMLQAERLGAAVEARDELRRLHVLADERFTAVVTGSEFPEGSDELDTEAQAVLVVRDLQMAPVEATLEVLAAEADLLDSEGFALAYDSDSLGRDLPSALERFVSSHPALPEVAALSAARSRLL